MNREKLSEIMTIIEGFEREVYKCTAGKDTIGFGFNMEQSGARDIWELLEIEEDFDNCKNGQQQISLESASILLENFWKNCVSKAKERCLALGENYNDLPEWHQFILADIVYNTGSISKWRNVIKRKYPQDVLFEARRNPKEIMDSRVSKIGYFFGLIGTLEEAHKIGIKHAKYLS